MKVLAPLPFFATRGFKDHLSASGSATLHKHIRLTIVVLNGVLRSCNTSFFTVCSLIAIFSAISLFLYPCATSCRISSSREVRGKLTRNSPDQVSRLLPKFVVRNWCLETLTAAGSVRLAGRRSLLPPRPLVHKLQTVSLADLFRVFFTKIYESRVATHEPGSCGLRAARRWSALTMDNGVPSPDPCEVGCASITRMFYRH
jgi:hypothetical protein